MKANGFFRKLNFLIALGGVFAALTFYGCGNLFSSADDAPANFSQPREGYGIVSGNLPSSDSASARTAMPSGGNTPSSYKVFAQSGSQKIEANVNNADRTFSIALPFGTWKITANGLLPNGRIIFTQTKTVTLSETNPNDSLDFTSLTYSTNPDDGDGEISLSVSFPPKDATSLIRGIEYILSKGEEKIIQNVSDADLRAGRFEIKHTTDNLGAWHLTIQFYGDFSNLVYRIDQTVNVYANLTTDTFEGSAPYISDGEIVLTGDLLADFQNTTLYVNATNGKDTNTGTQFDPLQTFNRALELVNNSTRDASTEFRIFLQTDVADGAMLELKSEKKLTVASAGADGTARTITSLGRTFIVPATSELTVQSVAFEKLRFEVSGTFTMNGGSISGNEFKGSMTIAGGGAIYVAPTGKATISNTNIFGNYATSGYGYGGAVCVNGNGIFEMNGGEIHDNHAQYGGAICTGTNAVTITNGIISNNTSTVSGGGVYVYGGTFTMSGGSIIGNESTDTGGVGGFGGGVHVYGGTFELKDGSKITGNRAKNGGGISTKNTATAVIISDGTISENVSSVSGGGIYANCPLTMNGGSINNNKSESTDGTRCFGGGVYLFETSGKFTMNDGEISGNIASDNGGGIYINDNASFTMEGGTISNNESEKSNGGGIYVYTNGTFMMNDGTVGRNKADSSGGGFYVSNNATFTMNGGTISGNKAIGSHGGGICIINNATFEMNNGTISGNEAKVNGGGVYVTGDTSTFGSFTMKNGTISENTANSGGGVCVYNGIFTMERGEISDNTAKGVNSESFGGGGIFLYRATTSTPGGKFTLKGGTVSRNNAEYGGGIWTSNYSEFAMDGGTFSDNKTTNKGNGAYVYPSCTFNMSGAAKFAKDDDVYLCSLNQSRFATITVAGALTAESPVATITPSGVYAEGRQVLSAGAGVSINNTICNQFAVTQKSNDAETEWKIAPDGTGYGVLKAKIDIYVRGTGQGWYTENGYDDITGDDNNSGDRMQPFETIQRAIKEVIDQNDGTDAYTIYVDGTVKQKESKSAFGMAVFDDTLDKDLNLTIKALSAQATLDANNLSRVMYAPSASGALNLTLENLVIMNASAPNLSGGGIQFLSSNGILTMTGCEVRDNEANFGGGIYTSGALKMENCTISGNKAGYGAGVHISGSAVTMTDCTITGNIATTNGGGICIEGGNATLTMTDGTIENNEAENGGGVYVNYRTFTMNGTAKISGNTAHGDGGGVAINGGDDTFTMNGGTISGNTAAYGAGIHVSGGGKFIMNGGTIGGVDDDDGNTAKDKNDSGGGGIHLYNGTVEMSGGEIIGNNATGTADDSGGGGIYIYHRTTNTFTMTGGTISKNTAGGNGGGVYQGAGSNFTSNIMENISDNTPNDVYKEPLP